MLRITQSAKDGTTCFKLEGKLAGPWVEELRAAATAGRPATASLDLSEVTFVDSAGLALLNELIQSGCKLHASSNFVSELLRPRNT